MRYHGGKTRLGGPISKVILKILELSDIDCYVEPFCGMCGVLVHVRKNTKLKIYRAYDKNESVIMMWNSLKDGWKPRIHDFNLDRFNYLKGNGQSSAEKGFFGHALTFGALYFQCYRPELLGLLEYSSNDVIERSSVLHDVYFETLDFKELQKQNLNNCLIYCDPPYERANRYYDEHNTQISFDSNEFWEACKILAKRNVIVISEQKGFFDKRCEEVASSKIRMIPLPVKSSEKRKIREYLCILTNLDLPIEEI